MRRVGHKGADLIEPGNTLASFDAALAHGVDMIELDVLPERVPLTDAVANLGRVALGVAGLAAGRGDLLRALTIDSIHERYRAKIYPELPKLIGAAREAGPSGRACRAAARPSSRSPTR
jgi:hypothetical protein